MNFIASSVIGSGAASCAANPMTRERAAIRQRGEIIFATAPWRTVIASRRRSNPAVGWPAGWLRRRAPRDDDNVAVPTRVAPPWREISPGFLVIDRGREGFW